MYKRKAFYGTKIKSNYDYRDVKTNITLHKLNHIHGMMTLAQIKKFELWPQPICSVVHKTFYTTIYWFSIIDHTNGDDYASPLLGILVMQDVHLGFLIAILPALAGHHGTRSARVIKSGLVHDLFHGIRHSGSWMDELFFVTTQNIYVLHVSLWRSLFIFRFSYFDLFLNTVYAAHYVYFTTCL